MQISVGEYTKNLSRSQTTLKSRLRLQSRRSRQIQSRLQSLFSPFIRNESLFIDHLKKTMSNNLEQSDQVFITNAIYLHNSWLRVVESLQKELSNIAKFDWPKFLNTACFEFLKCTIFLERI
eukprot:TRINITY_DN4642_c0_g1_i1.p1 TRINITY_DN4642_c0_g1~~TRINITY_DN4642_c0_g1_i1.p1  ORF type:complete len:122 (+),score=4.55 TRINITY_DN4642_c0_g1_i1:60-425(+)